MLFPILAGAVLGGLFVLLARRRGGSREAGLLAAGLVVAALTYVGLALAQADHRWLAVEAAGVAVFGALAGSGSMLHAGG